MTYMGKRTVTSACAASKFFAVLLCVSLLAYADGNTFTRVRYNGGSVPSKVDPKDWDNKLTVTPDAMHLGQVRGERGFLKGSLENVFVRSDDFAPRFERHDSFHFRRGRVACP